MCGFLFSLGLVPMSISLLLMSASAQTGTYKVLHNFTGTSDGAYPVTPLALDKAGNLYSMTGGAGSGSGCPTFGCGTAFELSQRNGHWGVMPIAEFSSSNGNTPGPIGSIVVDAKGNVYWTDQAGGDPSCDCGAVLELTKTGGVWTQTTLYSFLGGSDGRGPDSGLVQDKTGNLYGTTGSGGSANNGTVFELVLNPDASWTYKLIYSFTSQLDGGFPLGQITVDAAGNVYGTTGGGGLFSYGTVYKLSPSSGGWTLTTIYNFTLDFGNQQQQLGVAIDGKGNLYGVTQYGGEYQLGTVYQLTPAVGYWNQSVLHTFTGNNDGAFPRGQLTIDQSGAVYGTAVYGGIHQFGTVYKLVRAKSGQWNAHVLHSFGGVDGDAPENGVAVDSSGNIFGSAVSGGTFGFGVAFEITP
jgi:uncharacterized repeat protein (TIGR03803 family)